MKTQKLEDRVRRVVLWYGFINEERKHINQEICFYKELHRWFTVEPRLGQNIQAVTKKELDSAIKKLVKKEVLKEHRIKITKDLEVYAFSVNDGK